MTNCRSLVQMASNRRAGLEAFLQDYRAESQRKECRTEVQDCLVGEVQDLKIAAVQSWGKQTLEIDPSQSGGQLTLGIAAA